MLKPLVLDLELGPLLIAPPAELLPLPTALGIFLRHDPLGFYVRFAFAFGPQTLDDCGKSPTVRAAAG